MYSLQTFIHFYKLYLFFINFLYYRQQFLNSRKYTFSLIIPNILLLKINEIPSSKNCWSVSCNLSRWSFTYQIYYRLIDFNTIFFNLLHILISRRSHTSFISCKNLTNEMTFFILTMSFYCTPFYLNKKFNIFLSF